MFPKKQPKLILELPDDNAAERTSAAHNNLFDMSTRVPVHKFLWSESNHNVEN